MKEAFFIDFRKIVSVLSYLRSLRLRKLLLLLLLLSSQQYVRRSQVNHCTQHTGNQSSSGRQVATVGSPSTLRWHLIVSKFRGRESFSLQRGKYLFKNKGASLCTRFVYQQCSFSAQAQAKRYLKCQLGRVQSFEKGLGVQLSIFSEIYVSEQANFQASVAYKTVAYKRKSVYSEGGLPFKTE